MVIPAVALFFYGLAVWFRGTVRAWSETDGKPEQNDQRASSGGGARRSSRLALSGRRRTRLHLSGSSALRPRGACIILLFSGDFFADFVSTSLAFIYQDFLHELPPYPVTSAPVIFGTLGGVMLIIGTAGLICSKWKAIAPRQSPAPTAWTTLF